jgi:hypothetical protein
MACQVGGVIANPMASQMVIFPTSMELAAGLTFMVGTCTWTTGVDHAVGIVEVVQGPPTSTGSTSTPTDPTMGALSRSSSLATRRPLPRYPRRQINNSNLIEYIDRVTASLADTLVLVDSIKDQSAEHGYGSNHRHQTKRPTRTGH